MSECVLDASAVLALLQGESGSAAVQVHAAESWVSAPNIAEVYGKLLHYGIPLDSAIEMTSQAVGGIVSFDDSHARIAAGLLTMTRSSGLSLGDRACLALAIERKLPVLTADQAWRDLRLGVEIRVIR